MRQAVVTGATGFTGPFVVRELRGRFPDLSIRCVVRPTSRTDVLQQLGVTTVVADLRDSMALEAAFHGADTLINVASLGFDWTDSVVGAAQRAAIGRAIFIGTTAMLTRLPVKSKPIRLRAEQVVRNSRMNWTILRPTMIYGTPSDRNIARLIRFIARSPIVPIVGGHALQQPVHVEDVAKAVAGALSSVGTAGRAYNISGRNAIPFKDLVLQVVEEMGCRRMLMPVPLGPVVMAVRFASRFVRVPVSVEQLQRLGEDKAFSHEDAAADFGYDPREFRNGVRSEIELMKRRS